LDDENESLGVIGAGRDFGRNVELREEAIEGHLSRFIELRYIALL
jgi:hypothetical protein